MAEGTKGNELDKSLKQGEERTGARVAEGGQLVEVVLGTSMF